MFIKISLIRIWLILLFHSVVYCNNSNNNNVKKKPHIILILVDDMGFNDVGYHGSDQIPTPNIDALAYLGITLNKFYTPPLCSPSRASLLTGKYPTKLGLQGVSPILPDEPWALDLKEKLLPEYLRESGYSTQMIGKWHLGSYRKAYTPTFRGFDSHFGYYNGLIDYWNYTMINFNDIDGKFYEGRDLRCNLTANFEANGTYATDLLTDYTIKTIAEHNPEKPLFLYFAHVAPHSGNDDNPVQAPSEIIEQFNFIKDPNRRVYAAMVSKLDESVGKVIDALKAKDMLSNSVILFLSDNGGATIGEKSNFGSNYPLRGQKNGPWEGAIRSNGIIWSPLLNRRERVTNQLIHITDIFTTIMNLANASAAIPPNNPPLDIDGLDIWPMLLNQWTSPRKEILCNYDDDPVHGYSSYISNDWKYINGTTFLGVFDGWLAQSNTNEIHPSFLNYSESILNSSVAQALLPYRNSNLQFNLTFDKHLILHLREQATINCRHANTASITVCSPLQGPCLFNLKEDPCEIHNLAQGHGEKLIELQNEMKKYIQSTVPNRRRIGDIRSNPEYFNNTWTWWYDELNINSSLPNYNFSDKLFCFILLLFLYKFL